MVEIITRAHLLTVSTKGDLSDESIEKIVKWATKSTVHAYIVTEHGQNGKLHLHGALVFKEHTDAKATRQNVWARFVKPHHPDSIGAVAVRVQVMPGHKWYDEYLRKEAQVKVLLDTYDREAVTEYLPSSETQDVLQSISKKRKTNEWWDELVASWAGSAFENSPEGAGCFMLQQMNDNHMQEITDDRRLADHAYTMWRRRNKICTLSQSQLTLIRRKDMAFDYSSSHTGMYVRPDPSGSAPPRI